MKDITNVEEIRAKEEFDKKESKRKRDRELSDIRKIVAMPEGRRFIWRVLTRAGIYTPSFAVEQSIMSFNEGKRNIGLFILEDLMRAKPEAFMQMSQENYSEIKSKKEEVDARTNS